jgi:uncharacterized protein YcaQ
MTHVLSKSQARRLWLRAQRLDVAEPFGKGSEAVKAAVEQLGYVQIDTINVIERCHHHILYNRIPQYRRDNLRRAQSHDKSVFEYWTHALSYVPVRDFRFYSGVMKQRNATPVQWFGGVSQAELRAMVKRIRVEGPLTIRDIEDDVLVDKDHPWASRKPSKRVMQLAFLAGLLVISARSGMLKTYELTTRHFGWDKLPRAATERQIHAYMLERALRSQAVVSLDSICHLEAKRKPGVRALIESRVKRKELLPVTIEGSEKPQHWIASDQFDARENLPEPELTHILSPFDPLIIQRKRTELMFDYAHLFEAYVPKAKRKLGYFALPVVVGEEIVAALDLKTDRENKKLLMQSWHWVGKGRPRAHKKRIEEALHRFETFQLGD